MLGSKRLLVSTLLAAAVVGQDGKQNPSRKSYSSLANMYSNHCDRDKFHLDR